MFIFDPHLSLGAPPGFDIHFFKFSLSAKDSVSSKTLRSTYEMLKSNLTGRHIDYLKMDTKSSGWGVITEIVDSGVLEKVSQLAIQIHFKEGESVEEHRRKMKILKSIEDFGMVRFSSRPSYSSVAYLRNLKLNGYLVYELAWYNPLHFFIWYITSSKNF